MSSVVPSADPIKTYRVAAIPVAAALVALLWWSEGPGSAPFVPLMLLPLLTFILYPGVLRLAWASGFAVSASTVIISVLENAPRGEVIERLVAVGLSSLLAVVATKRYLHVWAISAAQTELETAHLTTGLADGAFFRLRTEEDVLRTCTQILGARGLRSAIGMLDGDRFRVNLSSRPAHTVRVGAVVKRLTGKDVTQETFPIARIEGLSEAIANRRSLFLPDTHRFLSSIFSPFLAAAVMLVSPGKLMLVPLWVDGAPYALLVVLGSSLGPSSAATLELLGRHLEGALENVRHHQRATESLRELQRLQAELVARERLAALGEAAAVVAHEVRNPLGAIVNAVGLLRRQLPGHEDHAMLLDMVDAESRRLNGLVSNLLFLARPLVPSLRAVDLRSVVQTTVHALRTQAPFHQLALEVKESCGSHCLVQADPTHLQLVMENLLLNAAQVSPPGGRIRVGLQLSADAVLLAVDDQGPGVAEAVREKVFEPFFTTRATGTGLGLSIVRRVVKAHGGDIRIGVSDLGGASFQVTLAASAAEA